MNYYYYYYYYYYYNAHNMIYTQMITLFMRYN
jgi:hypothetical protein